MTNSTYFESLAALLRERDVPRARIDTLVGELTAYAEEAGGEAAEEFGAVTELAAQLSERESGDPAGGLADADGQQGQDDGNETWVWTADAFKDQRLLEQFGGQGWEVERLDRLGRFVCRRDLGHPMRWGYRRETVGHSGRDALTERLGPEGWELCGVWGPFTYYKRPVAVLDGPAARLTQPPAPPQKRVYMGKWLHVWIAACVLLVVLGVWRGVVGVGLPDASTLAGAAVGLVVGGVVAGVLWRSALRQRTPGSE